MLDAFHLPDSAFQIETTRLFWPTQPTGATTGWQVWTKPPNKKLLQIIAISGGGGGGSANAAASGKRGGGAGGGSSGISRYLYPMWAIPDNLYVLVGAGGAGGASVGGPTGNNGVDGQLSYVALYPNIAANNLFAVSGAAAPAGGSLGDQNSTALGGVAGTIATDAGAVFSCWAITDYIAGVAGSNGGPGGAGAAGADLAIGTGCMILGGTGAGGNNATDIAGGNITSVANTPFLQSSGGAAGAFPGSSGFRFGQFPIIYGGTGAGASASAAGADGGGPAPSPGGGGGGSGGGTTASGNGGSGGPGLVMMIAW